ncbi:4921_t:CDS:2, partial [Acaulospora colombiana]
KRDSEVLATVVTILSIALCLCTVALFPVDIFLVSSTINPETGLKHSWATKEQVESIVGELKFVYYGMYGLIALFCAVLIPFAYFYFEELEEDETNQQAPGLSLLPIGMIKGTKQYDSMENMEIVNSLVLNREKQRIIRSKYQGSNDTMSRVDTKELEKLQAEERVLVHRLRESEASRVGIWNKILLILRPLE